MTFIDTNILLDVITNDPIWADWSIRELDRAALRGPMIINGVVYAELSVRFTHIEELDEILRQSGIEIMDMPRAALFLAGKVFQKYRAAGGSRNGVLPDFFIGAHAAVAGLALLTRDIGRYRTYFPSLTLISPSSER